MCGIAGIVRPRAGRQDARPVEARDIRAMTAALVHRGPDASGYFERRGVALGHRRLKIIDLEGGAQPMANAEGTVWATYNGEIYNHDALRRELVDAGHRFATRCDTEVLVHGYRAWGPEGLLERIEGMYAFGIWDTTHLTLTLARDRMGQKPLFYSLLSDGTLVFASEVKALLAHPAIDARVCEAGLAAYLTHEYLPGELSMVDGVRKLLPGTWARFHDGAFEVQRYWDIPTRDAPPPADAIERFTRLFDASVRARLMSDVPLGVFLSGGVDSSSVAASVVRQRDPATVMTFSIGFEEKSYDESASARLVADHLGTQHHERVFSAGQMLDVLPRVASILDEPFGDASLLPTYLLSEFARERVTVALGGDGGDELLLGYPTFAVERHADRFAALPAAVRSAARASGAWLPVSTANFSFDFKVNAFLRAADAPADVRHPLWLGSVVPGTREDPLHPELRARHGFDDVLAFASAAYTRPSSKDTLQRLSYQYCRTYLADDILHKVDRASMAVSLEARSPFLDRTLVEFIAGLPSDLKLKDGRRGKHLLKEAVRERLPAEIYDRPKKGFGIPVAAWLKGSLRELTHELLGEQRVREAGYFEPAVVRHLIDAHERGRYNYRKVLWTLLSFELWRDARGVGARS